MGPLLTRRTALAAGGVASAIALGASGEVAWGAAAGLPAVKPRRAGDFADSVGVQTHLTFDTTPYMNVSSVVAALRGLGLRHVRDDLVLGRTDLYNTLNLLAAYGIGADLITGTPLDAPAASYAAVVANELSRVDSVEGTNEWDLSGRPDWAQEVYGRQQQLFAAMRSDPRTAGVRVLAPALAYVTRLDQLAAVGPLGAVSDAANVHAYPGGKPMAGVVDGIMAGVAPYQPGQPVVITETGYHNELDGPPGHPGVPEQVAADYLPQLLLDAWTGGVARTYLYQLLDQPVPAGVSAIEEHFGLLRQDFSPKPAYDALRNLLALTRDRGSFRPKPLRVGGSGPKDLRHAVLARKDGTHLVVLWRDQRLYAHHRTKKARAATVHFELATAQPVRVYRPSSSTQPLVNRRTRSLSLNLGGECQVVVVGGSARRDLR